MLIPLYHDQGDHAPIDIQPALLEHCDGTRFNYSQTTPYVSKELGDFKHIHDTLDIVFADVFEWIRMQVSLDDIYFQGSKLNHFSA